MKKIIIILIAVLGTISCKKDPPIPKGNSLPFENDNIRVDLINSSMPSLIRNILFLDKSKGFVVTNDGKIYMTTNKGVTWTLQYTNPTPDQPLFQILFMDANVGYVVGGSNGCGGTGCIPPGGLILKTTDGGNNWTKVFTGSQAFASIASNNSGDLFTVTITNGILKSTNGGINWTTADSLAIPLDKIIFNNNYGFSVGSSGKIFRSSDNGNTWVLTTTLNSNYIADIKFINNNGFCIANYSQSVYKTTDNGSTWTQTYTSDFQSYVLTPLTNTSCLIFGSGRYTGGDFGTWNGAIRQTMNSGNNWTETELVDIQPIRYTSFYSTTEGFGVADRKLIKVTVK